MPIFGLHQYSFVLTFLTMTLFEFKPENGENTKLIGTSSQKTASFVMPCGKIIGPRVSIWRDLNLEPPPPAFSELNLSEFIDVSRNHITSSTQHRDGVSRSKIKGYFLTYLSSVQSLKSFSETLDFAKSGN